MNMVALIPARAGSKRIPGKNTKILAGQPLIAYTVAAAQQSGVFTRVLVCSDDPQVFMRAPGWDVDYLDRPPVPDAQPDIVWVRDALQKVGAIGGRPEAFAILRPTNPFRTATTIRRAYRAFTRPDQTADSLRAVELVTQHPGKMWTQPEPFGAMKPLLDWKHADGTPWHSSPTQTLPPYYVQNGSLEMAWTYVVEQHGKITGRKILPFLTEGYEGFDLNTMADWREAEYLIASGAAQLPEVHVAA